METNVTPVSPQSEDKAAAIIAYLWMIGFIIGIVLNSQKKTQLGSYHLGQSLGLLITSVVGGIAIWIVALVFMVIPLIGWIIAGTVPFAFWITMLVLYITGIMNAVNGVMKPVPVLGAHFEKWFGNAFR